MKTGITRKIIAKLIWTIIRTPKDGNKENWNKHNYYTKKELAEKIGVSYTTLVKASNEQITLNTENFMELLKMIDKNFPSILNTITEEKIWD